MIKINRTPNYTSQNQGAALITVLVIVFIIMSIITTIMVQNFRTIKRLTNEKVEAQATTLMQGAVNFGRAILFTSGVTSQYDSLNDIWAQPLPNTPILDYIIMGGYITDEQSKFNINNLVINGAIDPNTLTQFATLLTYIQIPPSLAFEIANYIASPINETNIMNKYTLDHPSYRPAGRPLIDLSELLLVKGMQSNWVYKLTQYVTVIPQDVNFANESQESSESGTNNSSTNGNNNQFANGNSAPVTVNVNTASAQVISARSGIPLTIAERMVAIRNTKPFQNSSEISSFLSSNGIMTSSPNNAQESGTSQNGNNSNNIDLSTLDTTSKYFTIHTVIDSGDYEFKSIALIYRSARGGAWPIVLWQHPE